MAAPPVHPDEFTRRVNAIRDALRAGYAPYGKTSGGHRKSALSVAARACGMKRSTLQSWYANSKVEIDNAIGDVAPAPADSVPNIIDPAEVHDAKFWRRKAADTQSRLNEAERALRELAGLASTPILPPSWVMPKSSGSTGHAIGLLHISDTHVGEVVRPEEVNGLNAYNPDIFRARLKRLIAATVQILPRWASDCRLGGVVVALNGDLISGDIHDELRRTNALTSQEQVLLCVAEFSTAIRTLADAFGKVWVVVTAGNHSRATEKTHSKRTAALSYDSLVGHMLSSHFRGDDAITIHVAPGRDAVYPVLNWNVFQTHGDTGSGGGKGFAGATLPIARNMRTVTISNAFAGVRYDIKLTGHYHTSANLPGNHLANGSVIGYNEFAMGARFEPETPQQWLGLIHDRWGLRERLEVRLEDPAKPEAPRIRVQARSA